MPGSHVIFAKRMYIQRAPLYLHVTKSSAVARLRLAQNENPFDMELELLSRVRELLMTTKAPVTPFN